MSLKKVHSTNVRQFIFKKLTFGLRISANLNQIKSKFTKKESKRIVEVINNVFLNRKLYKLIKLIIITF